MDLVKENDVQANIFPENEYKNGKLKKLRGRMLKKLLKYEFRALAPLQGIMLGILAVTTLCMCVLPLFNADDFVLMGLPVMLYLYSVLGTFIVAVTVPVARFQKTMFRNEGYLTLSVPATMEEHLFAKHLLAICGVLVALVGGTISVIIVDYVARVGIISEIGLTVSGVGAVFAVVELLLIVVLSCMALLTVSNALNCFGQRFSKKTPMIFLGMGFYFFLTCLFNVFAWIDSRGWLSFFYTPAGEHVGACIGIIVLAGINVFAIWYQWRYLNKKLNLK